MFVEKDTEIIGSHLAERCSVHPPIQASEGTCVDMMVALECTISRVILLFVNLIINSPSCKKLASSWNLQSTKVA